MTFMQQFTATRWSPRDVDWCLVEALQDLSAEQQAAYGASGARAVHRPNPGDGRLSGGGVVAAGVASQAG